MENLEQKALLVTYSASSWSGKAPSKQAEKDIQDRRGNADGTTKTHVNLVDEGEIKKNSKASGAVYSWYRENTLPWENRRGGARLLPGANYERFSSGLPARVENANARADEFAEIYPRLKVEWEPMLKGLVETIDPKFYPPAELMRGLFSLSVTYLPLPISPGSLTLKFLGRAELDALKAQIGPQWKAQEQAATAEIYKRLAEAVGHMADTLADPQAIFRDSLVLNLKELCSLIPDLNFTENRELAELNEATREKLAGIDPETLRTDLKIRGQIAGEAGALLAQITGAGARFIDMS